ncbi:hypothetical protein [Shinella sp. HZN7]|uniref:hypothetical protein n=1 Tax=Shinella sp. (strain HZN7) TaxID=879274 RepID=UPI0007DA8F85|nr:hypothetical protein [Shinella sp. HZN7]ANH08558.1 hypothetical protein shn_30895 [Shinella sp. HZN7]
MEAAPTLVLYAYTSKLALGDARWEDRTEPDYFYEDEALARQDLLALRDRLAADAPNAYPPICLERVETVPMTRSAIVALLNDGVGAIIGSYQIIEEIAVDRR